jgi:hypothetical protein
MELKILEGYQNDPRCPERQKYGASISRNGILLDLTNPEDPNLIDYISNIRELAIGFSRIIRYAGNSNKTVSNHCVRGAEAFLLMGEPKLALYFLLHEIEEVVGFSDIPGPVKAMLPPDSDIKKYSATIEKKMCEIYKLEYPFPKEIKIMDSSLAQLEMIEMKMSKNNHEYEWDMVDAANIFVHTYNKIMAILHKDFDSIHWHVDITEEDF